MKDELRIAALKHEFETRGILLSQDEANKIYSSIMAERPGPDYKVGDVVCIYQGMGEAGFGRLTAQHDDGTFQVDHLFGENNDVCYSSRSRPSQDWSPSSAEEAIKSFLARSGKKLI